MDMHDFAKRLPLILATVTCALAATLVVSPLSQPANAVAQSRLALDAPSAIAKLQHLASATQMTTACLFGDTAILDGHSVDLYREPNVTFGERCVFESRVCRNGVLTDGYYSHRSCHVRPQPL
jgi:hypothetical protein